MTLAPDFVTILSSADGKLMVKRHGIRDGQEVTRGYNNSYLFASRREEVWDVANLADVLENVGQRSCVIWGQHVAGLDSTQPHRRIARDKTDGDIVEPARYEDAAHRYLLLDLDGTESVPDWQVPLGQDKLDARVLDMLPPWLRGVQCWYALSASAGLKQGDQVKLRLAFWLERSITGDEARKRLGQTGSDGKRLWPAIDLSIYAAAQPIYIAPPRFEDGRVDPLGSDGIPGWKGLKRSDLLSFRKGFVPIHGRFGGRTPEADAAAGGASEACVPEIEPPPPREQQRSVPEGLEESDDDPALITALRRQIDWFKNTHDIGTSPGGGRVFKLASWLQKIRVGNKIITQAACRDILEEHYRDVTDEVVANAAATIGEGRGSVELTPHDPADPAGRFGPTMDELIRRVNAPPGAGEAKKPGRFAARLPSEGRRLPELQYLDDDKMLPRVPNDGCTVLCVGTSGTHKTGLLIKKGLDAVERGHRVLFVATEGGWGVEKQRLPAAQDARGMSDERLDAHWRTVVAPFALVDPADRTELIREFQDFRPSLVIIDVLGKSIGGYDPNEATTAILIMGAADELSRQLGATVLMSNHPRRDSTTGESLGSVMFNNLTFGEWHITREGAEIKVHVAKIKDGPSDFDKRYRIAPSAEGVPVIEDVALERSTEETKITPQVIERYLAALGANRLTEGLSHSELAAAMTVPFHELRAQARAQLTAEPTGLEDDELAKWRLKRNEIHNTLRNYPGRNLAKVEHLCARVPTKTAGREEWRWYLSGPAV